MTIDTTLGCLPQRTPELHQSGCPWCARCTRTGFERQAKAIGTSRGKEISEVRERRGPDARPAGGLRWSSGSARAGGAAPTSVGGQPDRLPQGLLLSDGFGAGETVGALGVDEEQGGTTAAVRADHEDEGGRAE